MKSDDYHFRQSIPVISLQEIERLVSDGYRIHKEWSNGIELRKGNGFRAWLLCLQVLFPFLLFPGFMRSVANNFYGYRYRLFVTFDAKEPRVLMV